MHAFMITGTSETARDAKISELLEEWRADRFDRVEAGDGTATVGIAEIRDFIRRLSLAPQYGPVTAGIIRGGQALTQEAQQALLKTLEEPPAHARIIIETRQTDTFLPTVLSRVVVFPVSDETQTAPDTKEDDLATFLSLLRMSPGKRLSGLEPFHGTREAAIGFAESSLHSLHTYITRCAGSTDTYIPLPVPTAVSACHALLEATSELAGNITPQLTLETVFFRITDPDLYSPGTLDMP